MARNAWIIRILLCFGCLFAAAMYLPARAGESAGSGGNLALCIGVDSYAQLAESRGSVADALAMGKSLSETGDFRKIIVLSDQDANGAAQKPRFTPTRANILNSLRLLANNAPSGAGLMVFFSGHGMIEDGAAYLMPSDANGDVETAIALFEVTAIMAKSGAAKKTLLVDACRDSEIFPGLSGVPIAVAEGVTVIISCSEGQISQVDEGGGRGLFSLALEDALRGEADGDGDGAFTAKELFAFLETFMSDYCLDKMVVEGQRPVLCQTGKDEIIITGYASAAAGAAEAPEQAADAETDKNTPEKPIEAASPPLVTEEMKAAIAEAGKLMTDGKQASAFAVYLGLANQGMTEAEAEVGFAYYYGRGVEQDYKKAAEWFRKAGEKGNVRAQEMLGSMYYFGKGVEQDLAQSAKWNMLKGRTPDADLSKADAEKGEEAAGQKVAYEILQLDESGTRYYGDAGPALRFEIVRPDMEAITIDRLQTDSVHLSLSSTKKEFAKGERALVDLRVVSAVPSGAMDADVTVHLASPRQVLTKKVLVKSDAPVYAQTYQTQTYQAQTYQAQPQQYQNRQYQQSYQQQYQQSPSSGSTAAQTFGRVLKSLIF